MAPKQIFIVKSLYWEYDDSSFFQPEQSLGTAIVAHQTLEAAEEEARVLNISSIIAAELYLYKQYGAGIRDLLHGHTAELMFLINTAEQTISTQNQELVHASSLEGYFETSLRNRTYSQSHKEAIAELFLPIFFEVSTVTLEAAPPMGRSLNDAAEDEHKKFKQARWDISSLKKDESE